VDDGPGHAVLSPGYLAPVLTALTVDDNPRQGRAVVFDLGETLSDETRSWAAWAEWLGVSHFTLFALVGSMIGEGRSHRDAFSLVRPGLDMEVERGRRAAAGASDGYEVIDLYPDVVPCVDRLRADGWLVGVAGNQPAYAEIPLRTALPGLDLVGLSAVWGVEKPAPAFFERIGRELGLPASRIVFVGDRLDNDVLPAQRAGMTGVLLRRGPWGFRDAASAGAAAADLRVDGLAELPDLLVDLLRG
jgi:FMN phosphatase YigB (HAD superfamily)